MCTNFVKPSALRAFRFLSVSFVIVDGKLAGQLFVVHDWCLSLSGLLCSILRVLCRTCCWAVSGEVGRGGGESSPLHGW